MSDELKINEDEVPLKDIIERRIKLIEKFEEIVKQDAQIYIGDKKKQTLDRKGLLDLISRISDEDSKANMERLAKRLRKESDSDNYNEIEVESDEYYLKLGKDMVDDGVCIQEIWNLTALESKVFLESYISNIHKNNIISRDENGGLIEENSRLAKREGKLTKMTKYAMNLDYIEKLINGEEARSVE